MSNLTRQRRRNWTLENVKFPGKLWPKAARVGWFIGPRTPTGCREWDGNADRDGYARIVMMGQRIRIARLILGLKNSDPRVAMHSCDNPRCVEPSHLRIGTVRDNVLDAFSKGRRGAPVVQPGARAGENNGRCKLPDSTVALMRELHQIGWRPNAIAEVFGVSKTNTRGILDGERR